MNLSSLKPSPNSVRDRKKVGRGPGGGHGKTSGKGHKGQKARSGYKGKSWSEGGQMPLQRRLPKRGFRNIFRVDYQEINVGALAVIDSAEINPQVLRDNGLLKRKKLPVKILGDGQIEKALNVSAHAFSGTAKEKIEKAGGKIEIIPLGPSAGKDRQAHRDVSGRPGQRSVKGPAGEER